MKLPHLLLMQFGTTTFGFLFCWLLSRAGAQASFHTLCYLSFPVAFFVTLLLAWPISRLIRLTPLMIFAGPCPGCRKRPPGWWATETGREKLLLNCGLCGDQLEVWLTNSKSPGWPPVGDDSSVQATLAGVPRYLAGGPVSERWQNTGRRSKRY